MTLTEIRLASQQRADMVNSSFVSDAEWTTYINGSLYELYDLLVGAYGSDYYSSTYSLTTTGSADTYALPADFYKLTAVDVLSGGTYLAMRRFNHGERDMSGPGAVGQGAQMRYRLKGSALWLAPRAASGQTVRIEYVPRMVALADPVTITFDGVAQGDAFTLTNVGLDDAYSSFGAGAEFDAAATDTLTAASFVTAFTATIAAYAPATGLAATSLGPVVTLTQTSTSPTAIATDALTYTLSASTLTDAAPSAASAVTGADGVSGWLDYVIVDAAIKALQKEESDVSVLFAQKQALLKRIEAMAENRDAGSPGTVVDVTASGGSGWWP